MWWTRHVRLIASDGIWMRTTLCKWCGLKLKAIIMTSSEMRWCECECEWWRMARGDMSHLRQKTFTLVRPYIIYERYFDGQQFTSYLLSICAWIINGIVHWCVCVWSVKMVKNLQHTQIQFIITRLAIAKIYIFMRIYIQNITNTHLLCEFARVSVLLMVGSNHNL